MLVPDEDLAWLVMLSVRGSQEAEDRHLALPPMLSLE
jgi:hypothetical protein